MKITPEIIDKHGIKPEEYKKIISLIEKKPNLLELGIFSAMWNEHCSYKSSKKYLKTLPTKNKKVIQGPGENAGVIDVEDNDAIVFKIESHNHPSYIEPYQGAATGVGGILRDIFTMGARPIASMKLGYLTFFNFKEGISEAFETNVLRESDTPGAIIPPKYLFLIMTSNVVAVPKSTMI